MSNLINTDEITNQEDVLLVLEALNKLKDTVTIWGEAGLIGPASFYSIQADAAEVLDTVLRVIEGYDSEEATALRDMVATKAAFQEGFQEYITERRERARAELGI